MAPLAPGFWRSGTPGVVGLPCAVNAERRRCAGTADLRIAAAHLSGASRCQRTQPLSGSVSSVTPTGAGSVSVLPNGTVFAFS